MAPSVMKSVLTAVLTQDETVDRATSTYPNDIFVNEDVLSVQCVENHLLRYGLECKPAEHVADGASVLGLDVWGSEESYVGSATTHSARFRTRCLGAQCSRFVENSSATCQCSPVAQAWNLAMFGNNNFFSFFNSSWGTDEILPGWELASGLAFSESNMAAKDGNRIMRIDISS